MPTTYNGDGVIPISVNGWGRQRIVSITATTPVQVILSGTTSGFNNGDTVGVEGVSIYTALNGLWVITTLSTTGFSLNGSTAGTGGTTSGYALDYSVLPQVQLPSDGVDLRNAASVNAPLEAAFNLAPYQYKRHGAYSLYQVYTLATADSNWFSGAPHTWSSGTQVGNSAWNDTIGLTWTSLPSPYPVVQAGDLLIINFSSSVTMGAAGVVPVALGIALTLGYSTLNAATVLVGSAVVVAASATVPIELEGYYVCQAADANKRLDVSIMIAGNAGSPNTYAFKGDRQLIIQHYRSNA